ncbi:MAG: Holliday junction resolvase RuvX [Calditrichia bacterium]
MSRILSIDLGEKRIGIAISDPTQTLASPLKTIRFKSVKQLIDEIQALLETYRISKIVVGLPLTMKGTYSAKTKEVVKVFKKMQQHLPVEMELYDESGTTVQAQETLRLQNKKPSKNRERIDQIAASHILQNYLNGLEKKNIANGS